MSSSLLAQLDNQGIYPLLTSVLAMFSACSLYFSCLEMKKWCFLDGGGTLTFCETFDSINNNKQYYKDPIIYDYDMICCGKLRLKFKIKTYKILFCICKLQEIRLQEIRVRETSSKQGIICYNVHSDTGYTTVLHFNRNYFYFTTLLNICLSTRGKRIYVCMYEKR